MKKVLYHNGNIITMVDGQENPEALLVDNGRIKSVGKYADLKCGCEEYDLKGKTLLPGFIDGHSHLSMARLMPIIYAPPLGDVDSIDKLIVEMKEILDNRKIKKGKWLLVSGYDNRYFEGDRHPSRYDLDKVSKDIPIVLIHVCGHIGVLNSKAIEVAGINKDTITPKGGVIERDENTNEPLGRFEETAFFEVIKNKGVIPPVASIIKSIEEAMMEYASYGYTTIQDGQLREDVAKLYKLMGILGKLKLDVIGYPEAENGKSVSFENIKYKRHFRYGGVKLFLDGSPQGKTAWFTKPYKEPPKGEKEDYCGYPKYDDSTVEKIIERCVKKNWQVLTHANGDAAMDQLINAYSKIINKTNNKRDLRPVMIHAQTIREDQLDRLKEIGMMPSFFHDHVYFWGDYHLSSVLGEERGRRISPLSSAVKREIPFTIHHDTPVTPPNAIFALHNAVNRRTQSGKEIGPEYAVDIFTALKTLTVWGAYQYHEENIKGTLTVGKYADMIVLDKNPMEVNKDSIKDIKVVETIKEGKTVYKL